MLRDAQQIVAAARRHNWITPADKKEQLVAEWRLLRAKIARLEEQMNGPTSWRESTDLNRIAAAVSKAFGITEEQLRKKDRHEYLVAARFAFYLIARRRTILSNGEIGVFVGRDHGAVIWGSKQATKRMELSPSYARTIREIEEAL